MWDGHGTLGLKNNPKYIHRELEHDRGNSADMNQGARLSGGEYLCFIENDVILHPDWLPNMIYYLENNLADVVIPIQYHTSWENVQKWKSQSHEEGMNKGIEEAGMLMMRKDDFERIGGWDERIKKFLMWDVFQRKLGKAGLRTITTYKTFITHIGGVSYWWDEENDKKNSDKIMQEEIKIRSEF